MSHLKCVRCGSTDHNSGYGYAAGILGAYSICECGAVLNISPDCEGMTEQQEAETLAACERINATASVPSGELQDPIHVPYTRMPHG